MRFRTNRSQSSYTPRRLYPLLSRSILIAFLVVAAGYAFNWRAPQFITGDAPRPAEFDTAENPTPDPELGENVVYAHGPGPREMPPVEATSEATPEGTPVEEVFPINRDAFNRILDKTSNLPVESYYNLLEIVAETPVAKLKAEAKGEDKITYLNLWQYPVENRGQLIRLKGHIRGAIEVPLPDDPALNPTPYRKVYQCDLFTHSAGYYPYIVIVPELPKGMPQGRGILEDITVTGFFLKLWRYESAERKQRAAPLLIAKIIDWRKTPSSEEKAADRNYVTVIIAVGGLIAVGVLWGVSRAMYKPPAPLPPARPDERSRLAALANDERIEDEPVIGPPPTVEGEPTKPDEPQP